jgi:polyhydroxybutyrate depolymerase
MGRTACFAAAVVALTATLLATTSSPNWGAVVRADSAMVVDPRAPQTAVCAEYGAVDCTRRLDYRVGRTARTAYLYLPPAAATRRVPMVIVVHGYRMTPRSMDDATGWTALARREGFAVTFPLGYGAERPGNYSSWNAGHCCGPASRDRVDDVAMMDTTVRVARAAYPSDGRVFYAGFSNGAMLAYRLQCTDRGPFRAFVAVNGTLAVSGCTPRGPRPFLAVHAHRDSIVPYAGCTLRQAASSCARILHADLPAGPAAVSALRRASGCTGAVTRRYAPHVLRAVSTGCRRPGPVHMTIDNAGHSWVTDETRYGIDETEEAWRFLRTAVPYLDGR